MGTPENSSTLSSYGEFVRPTDGGVGDGEGDGAAALAGETLLSPATVTTGITSG